mgnify:CR=1 FL=1
MTQLSNKQLVRREEDALEAQPTALDEVRELRVAIRQSNAVVARLAEVVEAQALAISKLTEEVGQFRADYRDATFDSITGEMPDSYAHLPDAEHSPGKLTDPMGARPEDTDFVERGPKRSVGDLKCCGACQQAPGDQYCNGCGSFICATCYRDDCLETPTHKPQDHWG